MAAYPSRDRRRAAYLELAEHERVRGRDEEEEEEDSFNSEVSDKSEKSQAEQVSDALAETVKGTQEQRHLRHLSCVHMVLDVGFVPFVSKSSVVLTGWLFMNAITETERALMQYDKKELQDQFLAFCADLLCFFVMTVLASLLSREIGSATHPDRAFRIYTAALALFPAWKWRDADVELLTLIQLLYRGPWKGNPDMYRITRFLVLTESCVLLVVANWVKQRMDHCDVADEQRFWSHALAMIQCSLALGVAWSWHMTCSPIYGWLWQHLSFRVFRLIVFTAVVLALQKLVNRVSDIEGSVCGYLDPGDGGGEVMSSRGGHLCLQLLQLILPLVLEIARFILGLSYNNVLEHVAEPWRRSGPLSQFMVSLSITLSIGVIVGSTVLCSDHLGKPIARYGETMSHVAGLNVGLTWIDFGTSMYLYAFHCKLSNERVEMQELVPIWVFTLVCTLLVLIWAYLGEMALQCLERVADEVADEVEELVEELGSVLEESTSDNSADESGEHPHRHHKCHNLQRHLC